MLKIIYKNVKAVSGKAYNIFSDIKKSKLEKQEKIKKEKEAEALKKANEEKYKLEKEAEALRKAKEEKHRLDEEKEAFRKANEEKYRLEREQEAEKRANEEACRLVKEKEAQRIHNEEKIYQSKLFVENFENTWGNHLKGLVIVDSNIWMVSSYNDLFLNLEFFLEKTSSKIEMPSEQFDEILNLRKKYQGTPKSTLAVCALIRIEQFQNKNLLKIVPMGIYSDRSAYADPEIIKTLVDSSKKYSEMILISDDRELRIRANQLVAEENTSTNFICVKGSYAVEEFAKYRDALNHILIFSNPSSTLS